MAKKKKGFNFGSYMDQDQLNTLIEKGGPVAPTEEEIKVLKESEGDVKDIPVSSLVDYHNHTYKVLDNEDMELLVESIKEHGIILPLAVRKVDDDHYEIISGHRRSHAAKIIGLEKVPCLVTDVDDATADIMMVDTNLHREEILPSEKAKSYDLRLRAMRAKGMETNEIESDSQYEEMLARDVKSSKINVYRYRKLAKLIPELLDLVDSKDISVNAGVKLASVPKKEQAYIVSALSKAKNPVSIDAADKIATAARNGLTEEKILAILDGEFKPRKKRTAEATAIKEKNFKEYYPASVKGLSAADKEAFIADCIKEYIETHDTWNGYDI